MKTAQRTRIASLLLLIMTACVLLAPTEVKAASAAVDVKTAIQYVETEYAVYNEAWGQQDKVPTKEGYLFGGWYEDAEGASVIKERTQVAEGTKVYAKFVPSNVLSVKAQNHSTTENTSATNDTAKTRLVSSVDSQSYANVGFDIIDMESGREISSESFNTVYSKLQVVRGGKTKDYTPQEVFGTIANARGQKFIVLTLGGIPESKWDSDVYVRPYWTTYDGVKVSGLAKYVYVQDGLDGWVSVPVSLHSGDGVAAGTLNVGYDNQKLEYKGYRAGTVFSEMAAKADGSVVKCVGNVSTTADTSADDMYITLRFKVINNYEVANGEEFLTFTIENIKFANMSENFVSMNVLNVQY